MRRQWRPVTSANSIDVMAIVLNFDTQVPDVLRQKILSKLETTAPVLGMTDIQPIHGFQVTVGPNGVPIPTQIPGRMFTAVGMEQGRIIGPGYSEQVHFDANTLIYRTSVYRSWSEASARYQEVLGETLSSLSDVIGPSAIRLEYLDRFIVDSAERGKLSSVLKEGSRFLAPHIFNESGLWHSHTGALQSKQNGRSGVLQVHVDEVDLEQGPSGASIRTLQIMTAREDRFSPNSIEVDRGQPDMLMVTLGEMHTDLKLAFSEVVTEEVAGSIGL